MYYIERDKAGAIVAIHRSQKDNAFEEKKGLDFEIMEFLGSADGKSKEKLLALSDQEVIRVLDDLVELLIKKGVILFTELPQFAQDKLLSRRKTREQIRPESLLTDDII